MKNFLLGIALSMSISPCFATDFATAFTQFAQAQGWTYVQGVSNDGSHTVSYNNATAQQIATTEAAKASFSIPAAIPNAGVAQLALGTVTILNTSITANSVIVFGNQSAPLGILHYTLNPGVGFSVVSGSAIDTAKFSYYIPQY